MFPRNWPLAARFQCGCLPGREFAARETARWGAPGPWCGYWTSTAPPGASVSPDSLQMSASCAWFEQSAAKHLSAVSNFTLGNTFQITEVFLDWFHQAEFVVAQSAQIALDSKTSKQQNQHLTRLCKRVAQPVSSSVGDCRVLQTVTEVTLLESSVTSCWRRNVCSGGLIDKYKLWSIFALREKPTEHHLRNLLWGSAGLSDHQDLEACSLTYRPPVTEKQNDQDRL